MNQQEILNQLEESKQVLQACKEIIPSDKFLSCEEYNTILLNLVKDSLAESFDKIRNSPEPEIQGREISVGQFGATDSF